MGTQFFGKPLPTKPKPFPSTRRYDPDKLTLNYEWIERILMFRPGVDDIRDGDFWMTKRQQDKFIEFQRTVRKMARSGDWGDYATVTVDPELTAVIEDFLGISFAAQMSCYECGQTFDDISDRDAHEETCGL